MSASSQLLLLHHRHRSLPWSLRHLIQLLTSEQLTCERLARHCHATAVAGEDIWKLRAFSRLCSWQDIQAAAQASDERRRTGKAKSALDGLPISIKANLAVKDQALTAGSRILGEESTLTNSVPAVGYDAELVNHLIEDCGAICIGITNMDEFGMGSLGTNVIGGATKNPLSFAIPSGVSANDTFTTSIMDVLQQSPEEIMELHEQYYTPDTNHHYSAGGSSCGAAASIAHGSSVLALGSDTGGSIRLPAAWCGVVGLKTSYGCISRHGLVSYASSLDTVGYLTPTVDCASLVLQEIRKAQQKSAPPKDSTSAFYSTASHVPELKEFNGDNPLKDIKIGIPSAFVVEECPERIKQLWSQGAARLEQAGATVSTVSSDIISPKIIQNSLAAYYVLTSAEASSNLARYDGFRYGVAASDKNGGDSVNASGEAVDADESNSSQEGKLLQTQYASTRTQGFGAEVIRRILCGTAVLSSDKFHTHYEAAAKLRAVLTQQLEAAFTAGGVDYLLIPTALSPPPSLLDVMNDDDKTNTATINATEMFANDIMTVPVSLAGLTAVGVPVTGSHEENAGRSIESVAGLQLVGRRLDEANLLQVAKYLAEK